MVYITNYNTIEDYQEIREDFETLEPSTVIVIHNEKDYHYETIESIIILFQQILGQRILNPVFYLQLKGNDNSFKEYILSKYENVLIGNPHFYHYFIEVSFYKNQMNSFKQDGKHFYISHEICPELEDKKNIYFLTPLARQNLSFYYLPFREFVGKIKKKMPIYIVQGNLEEKRRDFYLLVNILRQNYPFPFYIKLIGRGKIPSVLKPFSKKIILKNNLEFQDYHQEFLDGYCLLTLTSKEKTPSYYNNKLTSSINYIKGYKLKCILDKDLQDIYHLKNSYVYDSRDKIGTLFYQSLQDFYR